MPSKENPKIHETIRTEEGVITLQANQYKGPHPLPKNCTVIPMIVLEQPEPIPPSRKRSPGE